MFMVDERLKFVGFKDFYKKAKSIKYIYERLSLDEKRIYKMYVYSNLLLKESQLDKIWEYLNEPFGSFYYISYDMLGVYVETSRI